MNLLFFGFFALGIDVEPYDQCIGSKQALPKAQRAAFVTAYFQNCTAPIMIVLKAIFVEWKIVRPFVNGKIRVAQKILPDCHFGRVDDEVLSK